jgi:hypothetical protein
MNSNGLPSPPGTYFHGGLPSTSPPFGTGFMNPPYGLFPPPFPPTPGMLGGMPAGIPMPPVQVSEFSASAIAAAAAAGVAAAGSSSAVKKDLSIVHEVDPNIPENETLYLNNLNDRVKSPRLKKELKTLMSSLFGNDKVLDIIAMDRTLIPNKVLFVEGLPESYSNEDTVAALFRQYPGFVEARVVANRQVAFVEFTSDYTAGVALAGLQSFEISPGNNIVISYAKR